MSYLKEATAPVPQTEGLPGQVENSAGGYSYQLDDFGRLERFLILGTEGGSYYAHQRELTLENVDVVRRCLAADGTRTITTIVDISKQGRAPKNDPAILALAIAASEGDADAKARALAALPAVCRTGTHLFQFVSFVEDLRGWGRGLRRAVAEWYDRDDVAYQLVKYRQRGGWTHRDVLRLAHPKPQSAIQNEAFKFATGSFIGNSGHDGELDPIIAFQRAQDAPTPKHTAKLVLEYGGKLPREALKTEHLSDPEVWDALLLVGMPITALIRNLATMTRIGLIAPGSKGARVAAEAITDEDRLRKGRVHPIQILSALLTYKAGQSARGSNTWTPVTKIVDALDEAFYKSFGFVEPSGKRTLLALDVSGSMSWSNIGGVPGLTPRVGSAAMALITAAVEKEHEFCAFSHELVPVTISPRQRLDDVLDHLDTIRMGGTDCSAPMRYALKYGLSIDTFVVYTDSETWAGLEHPSVALKRYRAQTGIPSKLIVVGMVANQFTIADPNDAGMLDVVGFDTATPNVITEFSK